MGLLRLVAGGLAEELFLLGGGAFAELLRLVAGGLAEELFLLGGGAVAGLLRLLAGGLVAELFLLGSGAAAGRLLLAGVLVALSRERAGGVASLFGAVRLVG